MYVLANCAYAIGSGHGHGGSHAAYFEPQDSQTPMEEHLWHVEPLTPGYQYIE